MTVPMRMMNVKYRTDVVPQAESVPTGIDRPGLRKSPDREAPAMIPKVVNEWSDFPYGGLVTRR